MSRRRSINDGVGRPCCYCRRKMLAPDPKEPSPIVRGRFCSIEHIIPRCYGGTNDDENLALACQRCNSLRGHLNHDIFVMFARHILKNYQDAPTILLRAALQQFITSLAEIAIRNKRESKRAISLALLKLGDDLKKQR